MYRQLRLLSVLAGLVVLTLGLAACEGVGSSNMSTMMQPMMRLSVADAPPADGAPHVVVQFTGVELTGNGGNPVTITFPTPKTIDLVAQSGTASAELFDQPIPPGSYGQVRLMVNADGNANGALGDTGPLVPALGLQGRELPASVVRAGSG